MTRAQSAGRKTEVGFVAVSPRKGAVGFEVLFMLICRLKRKQNCVQQLLRLLWHNNSEQKYLREVLRDYCECY
jgi:hypothetical protein